DPAARRPRASRELSAGHGRCARAADCPQRARCRVELRGLDVPAAARRRVCAGAAGRVAARTRTGERVVTFSARPEPGPPSTSRKTIRTAALARLPTATAGGYPPGTRRSCDQEIECPAFAASSPPSL